MNMADLETTPFDEDTSDDDDNIDDELTPTSRFWHFSQLVGSNVYIGGGNILSYKSKRGRAHLTRTIEQFNVEERTWQQLETTGDHHPGLTGVACASFGKYLFAYGGNNSERLNGVLSQLNLETLTWSQLSPETADGPMTKDASGMVHFGEDSLAVVCGYAGPRDPAKYNGGSSDRDSRFIERSGPSAEGGGWTNEMHIFNRKFRDGHSGMWTSPSFSGPRPPPCADFSLTSVDLYRAVLYGGRRGSDEDSNDFYLIDFGKKTITKLQPKNKKEDKWPKMRMGHHAACCLGFNTENPHLIISGGRLKHQLPPKDIWILNLATSTWKEIKLPDDGIQNLLGRWGHTFTAVTHSEGLVEVIMFGGCPGFYEVSWDVYKRKDFNRLSFPVSFILGLLDREWALLDVVDCSSHWNSTSKPTKLMPFDFGNPVMLDVLYSMEQDTIPVLTELISNQKIRCIILSSENTETIYKWPTFTKPSLHEPTWKTLCLILELANMNDLAKMIKDYPKKMKDISYIEEQHAAAVQKAITEGKPLNHTIIHGVFVGPARSGKNSLMERLLGRMPSFVSPSTGVADNVVQIKVIQKSSTVVANVEDNIWTLMDDDDEAVKLVEISLERLSDSSTIEEWQPLGSQMHTSLPEFSKVLESVETLNKSDNISVEDTKDKKQAEMDHDQHAVRNTSAMLKSTKPLKSSSPIQVMDMFKHAIQKKALAGLQKYFQKAWSLYLTNTGGQMEFQEVLPLLVSGPSIFFFTFRLDRDLNERYKIEYMHSDRSKVKPYVSSLTTMEGIMQTLASISAMGTFVYKGLHKRKEILRPKVFLVGTHKDQIDSKLADTCIEAIDQQLQEAIKSTSHYSRLVQFSSETQMIFTVDNFSNNDSDFQKIRSAVERVVVREEFQMTSPAHWLIFSLALRKLESPVISYDECFEIAKECNINEHAELDEALHFIHSKMGLIRYFNYEDTKNVVIIDPQFLFNKVTELIVDTFTFEKCHRLNFEDFKKKGIFSKSEFELISSRSKSGMKACQFGKLLEKLRIAAPLEVNGEPSYFFPCALAHADEVEDEIEPQSPIPPLMITFQCGYCPKGLPGALIKYLMTNEMNSCIKWELSCDKMFRNQVSFFVGPLKDHVMLKITATHLKLICILNDTDRGGVPLTLDTLCSEILAAVTTGVEQVTSDINYINAQHSLTFPCGCKGDHPGHLEFFGDAPVRLYCTKSESRKGFQLPDGHNYWFMKNKEPSDAERQQTSSVRKRVASESLTAMSQSSAPQLRDLLKELQPTVAHRWEDIGIMLRIPEGSRDQIKTDNVDSPSRMREILKVYSKQVNPRPSWEAVVEALESLGMEDTASHLRSVLHPSTASSELGPSNHNYGF